MISNTLENKPNESVPIWKNPILILLSSLKVNISSL